MQTSTVALIVSLKHSTTDIKQAIKSSRSKEEINLLKAALQKQQERGLLVA
jgi:hypothetical protein